MGVSNVVKPVTAPLFDRVDAVYDVNQGALGHRLRTRGLHLPLNRATQSHWHLMSEDTCLGLSH
jgi:hypothetical protein